MKPFLLLLTAILTFCILFCISIRQFYLRKMKKTYENLLETLDRTLNGELLEISYDESMDSAVAHRLNQLVQISQMGRDKANQERDTIKSLISDISHQVRTPLTNIMLYVGILEEKELNKDTRLLADKIRKQADKLDFYMKELVKSSYAEQEMITLHPEMVSIEAIILTSCQMAELSALKKKITITKDIIDAPCYADKKWTMEALANILDNAIKYSPSHSSIQIRVIPYESFLCVSVEDSGMGISEEEQGMVFERFYRSKTVSNEPGFGIGLYLVREVLTKQGGYAKIHSKFGKGTTVQIFLSRYPL